MRIMKPSIGPFSAISLGILAIVSARSAASRTEYSKMFEKSAMYSAPAYLGVPRHTMWGLRSGIEPIVRFELALRDLSKISNTFTDPCYVRAY
jgi:hypothetical protein